MKSQQLKKFSRLRRLVELERRINEIPTDTTGWWTAFFVFLIFLHGCSGNNITIGR